MAKQPPLMKLSFFTQNIIDSLRQLVRDDAIGDPFARTPTSPIDVSLEAATHLRIASDGMHGGLRESPLQVVITLLATAAPLRH